MCVATPRKRIVSCLLEAWADEFWVPFAMHYRWNYRESVEFFNEEAGRNLIPWLPQFVQNLFANQVANILIGYLPRVGVRPDQYKMIELWTEDICSKFDCHFQDNMYLLGDTPSIGDFGLAGPMVAHLGRDPYPRDKLIACYPHLKNWIERISSLSYLDIKQHQHMKDNETGSDDIPETLIPIIAVILDEFLPMIETTSVVTNELRGVEKFGISKELLPRSMRDIEIPLLGNQYKFKKSCSPFSLWKYNLVINQYTEMNEKDKDIVTKYFQSTFPSHEYSSKLFSEKDLSVPRLIRNALRVRFE